MKCEKCIYATFKSFGVYCESIGLPIRTDKQKKDLCWIKNDNQKDLLKGV